LNGGGNGNWGGDGDGGGSVTQWTSDHRGITQTGGHDDSSGSNGYESEKSDEYGLKLFIVIKLLVNVIKSIFLPSLLFLLFASFCTETI
jgi:hypothetical protein